MRLVPSVGPWLPWIKGILPYSVLLGGRAAELYFFSILGQPSPEFSGEGVQFGVQNGGATMIAFHEHLLSQGFKRQVSNSEKGGGKEVGYSREDLGMLKFFFPAEIAKRKPYLTGLLATPDPWVGPLLRDPHTVELKYLQQNYSIRIPQTGRFILTHGLQIKGGRGVDPRELFQASQHLLLLMNLLTQNEDLCEEALNDLLEVRPPALVKEFFGNLKENGPGSPIWEGAQRAYLETFPIVKGVDLTRWYWKFLPAVQKVLEEQQFDR